MAMPRAKLIEYWAKSPFMNGADVLIADECVRTSYPQIFEKMAEGRVVLTVCPEAEQPVFGKLASMLKSTSPTKLIVLTVDCSPDCYTLHASVNEAIYVSGSMVPKEHHVILQGEVHQISPEAIRLSRYLTLTQMAIERNPDLVELLQKYSLEQKCADEHPPQKSVSIK